MLQLSCELLILYWSEFRGLYRKHLLKQHNWGPPPENAKHTYVDILHSYLTKCVSQASILGLLLYRIAASSVQPRFSCFPILKASKIRVEQLTKAISELIFPW